MTEFLIELAEGEVPFDFNDLDEEQVGEFGDYLLQEMGAVRVAEMDEAAFRQWCEKQWQHCQEVDEAQDSREAAL